jgi:hypothetical protein
MERRCPNKDWQTRVLQCVNSGVRRVKGITDAMSAKNKESWWTENNAECESEDDTNTKSQAFI